MKIDIKTGHACVTSDLLAKHSSEMQVVRLIVSVVQSIFSIGWNHLVYLFSHKFVTGLVIAAS